MMAGIEARGRAIGAEAQQAAISRLAERIGEEMPGIEVSAQADGVELAGPGLAKRLLSDATLRWIGSLLR